MTYKVRDAKVATVRAHRELRNCELVMDYSYSHENWDTCNVLDVKEITCHLSAPANGDVSLPAPYRSYE